MADRKTAVITGASQGLGRSFAFECARKGYDLVLNALPDSGLVTVKSEIEAAHGTKVEIFELDLCDDEARNGFIASLIERGDGIDLLVNNASVHRYGDFHDLPFASISTMIRLNVLSFSEITHGLLPLLRKTTGSHVLNIASMAGFYPMPNLGVYSASKAFVLQLSRCLRIELRKLGIGVTVLCPGGIYTNPEVIRQIEIQGLIGKWSSTEPDSLARKTMRDVERNKAIVVPGFFNRFMRFCGTVLPWPLVSRILEKSLSRMKKADPERTNGR